MHAMLLRFASCISVLILKSQRHNFSQTNNFSQIIKFGVRCNTSSNGLKHINNYGVPNKNVISRCTVGGAGGGGANRSNGVLENKIMTNSGETHTIMLITVTSNVSLLKFVSNLRLTNTICQISRCHRNLGECLLSEVEGRIIHLNSLHAFKML